MKVKTYSATWIDAWYHIDFIPNATSFDEIIMNFLGVVAEMEKMRSDGVNLLKSTTSKPFITFYTTDPDVADKYQLNDEHMYEFDETGDVIDVDRADDGG